MKAIQIKWLKWRKKDFIVYMNTRYFHIINLYIKGTIVDTVVEEKTMEKEFNVESAIADLIVAWPVESNIKIFHHAESY